MLKYRAKYAGMVAGVAAPIYFLIQLILGSDASPALVRTLWFFLVIFLVCLAVKWEGDRSRPETSPGEEAAADRPTDGGTPSGPPGPASP